MRLNKCPIRGVRVVTWSGGFVIPRPWPSISCGSLFCLMPELERKNRGRWLCLFQAWTFSSKGAYFIPLSACPHFLPVSLSRGWEGKCLPPLHVRLLERKQSWGKGASCSSLPFARSWGPCFPGPLLRKSCIWVFVVAKTVNVFFKKGLLLYYRCSGAFNSVDYRHLGAKWWNQMYAIYQ